MSNQLILDFPVLQEDSGDFVDTVSYQVAASRFAEEIVVTHTLNGSSYISRLVRDGAAKFSVRLFYRDGAERRYQLCEEPGVCVKQIISLEFSYAPEILPSIVLFDDREITVDDASGLTDFWMNGTRFSIPKYSRIALGSRLFFTDGGVSNLMKLVFADSFKDGEMMVVVNEVAGEGEAPVSLRCGKKVFDCLQSVTGAEPTAAYQSMGGAIVTQALCAIYAYMQNLSKNQEYEVGGVLKAHLQMLEDRAEMSWYDDDFNPSLAATKMWPYVILNGGEHHD